MKVLDSKGMHYKQLNEAIKMLAQDGKDILIKNVNGHRYIGVGLQGELNLTIEGTPGNDMAAFMDGPQITVKGNAQDGIANTMNDGNIIIHGHAGDTLGYAMRGGNVYVKSDVGYRVGIHMKEYEDKKPVIVVGGSAGDFLGEYMAGGSIIVLGLNAKDPDESLIGNYCGTGMHGGAIYIRGSVKDYKLGKEVRIIELNNEDMDFISNHVRRYCECFGYEYSDIMKTEFIKLMAFDKRPYGNVYCYI